MSEVRKPVVITSIPKSKMSGELRLKLWQLHKSLLDEDGNEEPTDPAIHSELPEGFGSDDE